MGHKNNEIVGARHNKAGLPTLLKSSLKKKVRVLKLHSSTKGGQPIYKTVKLWRPIYFSTVHSILFESDPFPYGSISAFSDS